MDILYTYFKVFKFKIMIQSGCLRRISRKIYYTCDKQVLWESAGAFFSARQLSDFTRQLARFTRSWSSGKMLAFQPRGFVFEPVGMR